MEQVAELETGTDTGINEESQGSSLQNSEGLQERMLEQDGDGIGYSDTTDSVLDGQGIEVINPDTKEPFKTMEEYNAWASKQDTQNAETQKTEQPKQQQNQQPANLQRFRSFEDYVANGGKITPESLNSLAGVAHDYSYNDALVPQVVQQQGQQQQQAGVDKDPVMVVQERRELLESSLVSPIRQIRQAMIDNGAPVDVTDSILSPILKAQIDLVEKNYKGEMEEAMERRASGKYNQKLSELEQKTLEMQSNSNLEELARKYYPNGGKQQLIALINGHYTKDNDPGSFVRGPAVELVDLLASVSSNGKQYQSNDERVQAYKNMMLQLTANPKTARSLVNIAHYFWIGKNAAAGSKEVYEKGKQSAKQELLRQQRTIKTRPASYSAPANEDETFSNSIEKALFGRGK